MTLTLPLPPSFNLASTVESHGWYLLAPFRWNRDSLTLTRAETIGRTTFDLTVRAADGALSISTDGADDEHRDEIAGRARRMLQLDVDLASFHDRCAKRRSHRWVPERSFGRLLCGTTLFEDVVKIIATTNTTWRQTVRMIALLVDRFGARSPSGRRAFPTPQRLARASADELREHCRFGYRANYVSLFARGIASGSIDLGAIADPRLATADLFASYRTLPGIGPYGAAHLLAMDGRHDFIAVDTEFRRFVREKYFGGESVSDAEMLARYARWGKWKYLAYWSELWHSIASGLEEFENVTE